MAYEGMVNLSDKQICAGGNAGKGQINNLFNIQQVIKFY